MSEIETPWPDREAFETVEDYFKAKRDWFDTQLIRFDWNTKGPYGTDPFLIEYIKQLHWQIKILQREVFPE